ncbi:unnamed protein product [Parascedosporium putredinis]|uniref:Deacetylase sirtuin-type domain-containing protein n=1 Tax=Parascedosporium putredinis TaxID=1442378 RepID=A0A9P1GYG7_9PEZI|nr:unnamed protein product [Parascedosporium putredinis]CAI7991743.1 unnamed protein product [Parascedosporium putredinis]
MPTAHVRPEDGEALQVIANALDFRSENGLYQLIQAQYEAAARFQSQLPMSAVESVPSTRGSQDDASNNDEFPTARASKRRKLGRVESDEPSTLDGVAELSSAEQRTKGRRGNRGRRKSSRLSQIDATEPRSEDSITVKPEPALACDTSTNRKARRQRNREEEEEEEEQEDQDEECELPQNAASLPPEFESPPRNQTYSTLPQSSPPRYSDRIFPFSRQSRPVSVGLSLDTRQSFLFSEIRGRWANWAATGRDMPSSPPSVAPFPATPTTRGPMNPHHRRVLADLAAESRSLGDPPHFCSSSPLSSPPPVLFDPRDESPCSPRGSSFGSSTAPSETDETPPSSDPGTSSQGSTLSAKLPIPNIKGRDLFDASIWACPVRTSVFYTFATTLRQKARDVSPTTSHHFIGHLRDRGSWSRFSNRRSTLSRLSSVVSKEASSLSEDGLEATGESKQMIDKEGESVGTGQAPIDGPDVVAELSICQSQDTTEGGWDGDDREIETLSGRQPECPHCAGAAAARQERGKRALGVGKLRPDIVLYGEDHPNAHLISPVITHDLGLGPDLLLILGTSLKVHGLKVMVRQFAKAVHSKGGKVVFINFTKPPESIWGDVIDYWIQWDCDAWVDNLKERVPALWLPPGAALPEPPKKRKRESAGGEKKKTSTKRMSLKKEKTGEGALLQDTPVTSDSIIASGLPYQAVAPGEQKTEADVLNAISEIADKAPGDALDPSGTQHGAQKRSPKPAKGVKEDKINGAYLTWRIMDSLRRLSGRPTPPLMELPSLAATYAAAAAATKIKRNEAAKARRQRKSAPAALTRPDPAVLEGGPETEATMVPAAISTSTIASTSLDVSTAVAPDGDCATPPMRHTPSVTQSSPPIPITFHTPTSILLPKPQASILAAVKSNPRRRKRKVIDGEEVVLPCVNSRGSAPSPPRWHALEPSPSWRPNPIPTGRQGKWAVDIDDADPYPPRSPYITANANEVVGPSAAKGCGDVVLGLVASQVSIIVPTSTPVAVPPTTPPPLAARGDELSESLALPPLRQPLSPAIASHMQLVSPDLCKLEPMEPSSSPRGPLATISTNLRTSVVTGDLRKNPFFFADPSVMWEELSWRERATGAGRLRWN